MFELKNYHNVELTDEYINYYTCCSTQGTWITCTTLYQIKSYRSELDLNGNKIYKITKANVHYSNEVSSFDSEVGLYSTEDNDGTTYFYRGDVKNNYVSFGGFIWRIVRINGDGNIRMIYQGTSTNSTGEDAIISSSVYNDKQIVSSKWIEQITTPYIKCDEKFAFMQYGYLWWIIDEEKKIYSAIGDSGNVIYVNTDKNIVISVTATFKPLVFDRVQFIQKYIEPFITE